MLGTDYAIFGFIHPYGLCMALGIIGCFVFLMITMTKKNFNDEALDKMLILGFCATAFGVFMAAVVQGIYNALAGNGFDLRSMTFLGGLIGGVVSFLLFWNLYVFVIAPNANKALKKWVVKVFGNNMNATLSDAIPFVPPAITIAHAFGRLGCTFAGCCHGAETDAWYGIMMHTSEFGYAKVVPTQLFECLFLIVLSVAMILLYYKFKFNYNFSVYLIAYGVWRFLIEFIRADYRGGVESALTPSQWLSLVMIPLGVGFIFIQKYILSRFMKHPELQPPANDSTKKKAAATNANVEVIEEIDMSTFVPDERLVEGNEINDNYKKAEPSLEPDEVQQELTSEPESETQEEPSSESDEEQANEE